MYKKGEMVWFGREQAEIVLDNDFNTNYIIRLKDKTYYEVDEQYLSDKPKYKFVDYYKLIKKTNESKP